MITGIKTFVYKKLNSKFEKFLKASTFPKKNISFFQKKIIQFVILKKLNNENWDKQIQLPISQFTHPLFIEILKKIIPYNPNNLGNWSNEKPFNISGLMEKKIVQYMSNLLTNKKTELGGYITSGGTESNLFSMWLGKKYLKKYLKIEQLIVIHTGLTHYSISKSADITNLDIVETSLSSNNWGMSPIFLEKTVKKEYEKGKKGFLIPLTLGYTITGSDDPIKEIDETITKLKEKFPEIRFFCWIDAAFSGIIKPFVETNFHPFSYKNISTFLTDFHKFPAFPYPSGIILYKKNLIKNIQKKVSYIERDDTTILGSRSGTMSIAIWYCLKILNRNGFKKIIEKSLKEKNIFIKKITNQYPKIKIITQSNSVQAGIFSTSKDERSFLRNMGLKFTKQNIILDGKRNTVSVYKLYFLPFFKK